MKIVLFGASGMVGQGVLREALLDPEVKEIVTVVRSPSGPGASHAKVREVVVVDLSDFDANRARVVGFDACLFAAGVSAAGLNEIDYRRITYELTINVARTLVGPNPKMTFEYISGAGTDGNAMWARVKKETEDALAAMPFKKVYLLRPGLIRPLHGIKSRTAWYNAIYAVLRPIAPIIEAVQPGQMLTTESLGKAMIKIAKDGAPTSILTARDLRAIVS